MVMIAVSVGWGCSFLLIRDSLQVTGPTGVALARVAIGAAVLGLLPASRRAVPRRAWPALTLLAVTWMTLPMVLFALAEQHVSSSTAGMINGSAPIFTAVVAALLTARLPRTSRLLGLLVGLLGVSLIGIAGSHEESGARLGVALVAAAVALYGVAFNIAGGLQREYGALPVIWRAMLLTTLMLTPFGIPDLLDARLEPRGILALTLLGGVSTGACFALFAWLAGTLDATRASVVTYAVPVVALAVGVVLGGEAVRAPALVGIALVTVAAYLVQRPDLSNSGARLINGSAAPPDPAVASLDDHNSPGR
ncbi:DMT family transporter [Nonomuraea sp. NPDC049714]|uniref:DMT family transporter n=1 Tax=Nonomuraea sp. NPDC049714 TaxID=3364357 RepID=UPI00379E4731